MIVRVYGRVQGVGFRYSTAGEAKRLGIKLHRASNERDGSVYIEAEGDKAALAELAAWCEKGPPAASVERVERELI